MSSNFPESGIKLVAETSDYVSAMEEALSLAEQFDSISDLSISVTADTSEAASALEDLPLSDETVDFTVDVEQTGDDIEDLPVDGETITTELEVKETDTAEKTLAAVETLKNLKILETVWNIAGTAVDLFGKFNEFAIAPMLDLEDAIARIDAQTGSAVPNARELISGIFYDDLGDSIDQVGNLIIAAEQMKVPIDEAARAALTFTHTFQDQNPEQVLRTLNQLVINKLAPDFKTAGDMLVTAFQNGANKGGDLLTAIEKNATAINGLGLTGPEALSFIKTGMDNGLTSAEEVLKVLEKIKQNVTSAAGNTTSDVSKTLKVLGIANPAETGDAWTSEFFKQVIEGINNQPGLSDSEKEVLFTNLVGGKQGGKTFSAFLKMSPEDADNVFANMVGASERAATAVDNSLRGAIDDFMLAANKAAQEFLSSEQIDLPGKITALKEGLQDALTVLGNGGTLGDALTIALKPIGFDDEFRGLESALGNFVIGILQAVAQIQDLTGHGAEAAGTRATVASMAKQQLEFDLMVGNPDEVAGMIKTAVSRGVTPDQIAGTIGDAVDALISNGAMKEAQAIVDRVQAGVDSITFNVKDPFKRAMLESQGQATTFTVPITPDMTPEQVQTFIDDTKAQFAAQTISLDATVSTTVDQTAVANLQKQVDDAKAHAKDNAIALLRESKLALADAKTEMTPVTDDLTESVTATTEPLTTMNTQVATTTTNATAAAPKVQAVATATKTLGNAAGDAAQGTSDTAYQLNTMAGIAPAAAAGLSAVNMAIGEIIATATKLGAASAAVDKKAKTGTSGTGGNATPDGNAAGTDSTTGTFMTGEAGRELVTTNRDVAVLNNMTTEAIMAAIQGYVPDGSFNSSGGNSFNAYNTNIVQSQAQADALGYRTAAQLRGMSGALK